MQLVRSTISQSWEVTLCTLAVYILIAVISFDYYLYRILLLLDMVTYICISLSLSTEISIGAGGRILTIYRKLLKRTQQPDCNKAVASYFDSGVTAFICFRGGYSDLRTVN